MHKPQYKIYPSLLDAYQWYLDCENTETAFQDLIDKINRVPFESESAAKGTAFNALVDSIAFKGYEYIGVKSGSKDDSKTLFDGFVFSTDIVMEFVKEIKAGIPQVYCNGKMLTKYGIVELYGYIDELMPGCIVVDIKTTKSYDKGKYLKNWQHVVYPYCLWKMNNTYYTFTYLITDFQRIYAEDYSFDSIKDVLKLKNFIENFIEFLNKHKSLITDKKVFGGEKELAL